MKKQEKKICEKHFKPSKVVDIHDTGKEILFKVRPHGARHSEVLSKNIDEKYCLIIKKCTDAEKELREFWQQQRRTT